MVGRLLSFWDGISSGAMLNFRWVPKMVIIKAEDTFSKAHHFGVLQLLVFFSGCRE